MKVIRVFFQNPCRICGDCYDRFLIRVAEMRESCKIIDQVCNKIIQGPVSVSWETHKPSRAIMKHKWKP
jgi:NADH:ubiquinone oxidoreductase subunit D